MLASDVVFLQPHQLPIALVGREIVQVINGLSPRCCGGRMWYKVEIKVNVNIVILMRELRRLFASTVAVQECEIREMHLANLQDGSNFTN